MVRGLILMEAAQIRRHITDIEAAIQHQGINSRTRIEGRLQTLVGQTIGRYRQVAFCCQLIRTQARLTQGTNSPARKRCLQTVTRYLIRIAPVILWTSKVASMGIAYSARSHQGCDHKVLSEYLQLGLDDMVALVESRVILSSVLVFALGNLYRCFDCSDNRMFEQKHRRPHLTKVTQAAMRCHGAKQCRFSDSRKAGSLDANFQ